MPEPMGHVICDTLSGFVLPEGSGLRRDPPVPESYQTEEYHQYFDDRTLFYDCTWLAHANRYLFTAPPFGGLWSAFRDGLKKDGQHVGASLSRKVSGRSAQVFLPGPKGRLSLDVDDATIPIRVRPSTGADFTGLNAALTINKNNNLSWIADWARYHVSAHRLEAVVIFDNGSDAYGIDAISEVLSGVAGLRQAAVFSAAYRWGSAIRGPHGRVHLKYLQTALINLARWDMLANARAVFSGDIDELILSSTGASIFDAAAERRFGYEKIGGQWVFPPDPNAGAAPQRAHVCRPVPERPCQPKWCASPSALLSRNGWNVHNVGAGPGRFMPLSRDFSLLHCSAATTGWKPASNRFSIPETLEEDPVLSALMARHLPRAEEDLE